jgi:hypothetical protein
MNDSTSTCKPNKLCLMAADMPTMIIQNQAHAGMTENYFKGQVQGPFEELYETVCQSFYCVKLLWH